MHNSKDQEWLAHRRDLYLRNIIKNFYQSYDFFRELETKFKAEGLSYEGMESWVGTEEKRGILWQLKDLSHSLWKSVEPDEHPDQFMFDWMIGTLFHEAMKLKENLYILVNYRPSYNDLYFPNRKNDDQPNSCPTFFNEIADEINRNLKRIKCLHEKALNTLYTLVREERENALLIRFILDEKNNDPEKWHGEHGLGTLLNRLFPDSIDVAYCIAGESYLEGSWYSEARDAFEKALNINPNCEEARSALRILEKRLNEIAVLLDKEYAGNGI